MMDWLTEKGGADNTPRGAIAPRSGTAGESAAGVCGQPSFGARVVDTTERACQKIVLHRQLADLGMQVFDAGAVHGFAIGCRHEQIRGTFLQLGLPLHDLVWMHIILLG